MKSNKRAEAVTLANKKRTWYSPVAEIYLEARPNYSQVLIDCAIAHTKLNSDSQVLEVGSGPGNATIPFARSGASIKCIEHNRDFCLLAQQNTKQFSKVEIYHCSFEEWELEPNKYHAVLSANAFYQVPSEVSYQKAAAALKERGYLILLWNLTPELKYEVYQTVESIYRAYVPSLARYEGVEIQKEILQRFEQDIRNSGYFKQPVTQQLHCRTTYTIKQYLNLLSTLRRIDAEVKEPFFNQLEKQLQNQGSSVELSFLAAVHVAQKH